MENTFKVGDTVILKSGSLPMTVTEIQNTAYVMCTWYLPSTQSFSVKSFPTSALEITRDTTNP